MEGSLTGSNWVLSQACHWGREASLTPAAMSARRWGPSAPRSNARNQMDWDPRSALLTWAGAGKRTETGLGKLWLERLMLLDSSAFWLDFRRWEKQLSQGALLQELSSYPRRLEGVFVPVLAGGWLPGTVLLSPPPHHGRSSQQDPSLPSPPYTDVAPRKPSVSLLTRCTHE